MSIAALKKEVKKNIDKADERVLKMVNAMLVADQEEDWYDELPEAALVTCSVAAAFAAFLAFHPIVRGMQN